MMGLMDSLKFWEKKEEDPFANDPFRDRPTTPTPSGDARYPTGIPAYQGRAPSAPSQTPQPGTPPPSAGYDQAGDTAPPSPMPKPQSFPSIEPIHRVAQGEDKPKDFEIINLKLDAIKNALESINMRLERLERVAQGEKQTPNKVWYR